jgi:hypothetical protein
LSERKIGDAEPELVVARTKAKPERRMFPGLFGEPRQGLAPSHREDVDREVRIKCESIAMVGDRGLMLAAEMVNAATRHVGARIRRIDLEKTLYSRPGLTKQVIRCRTPAVEIAFRAGPGLDPKGVCASRVLL